MNKTMAEDVQRARAELVEEDSIAVKVNQDLCSIMERSESFYATSGSYEQPFIRCMLDFNLAAYALICYDSALGQLLEADDAEFVLLCQEAVKEYSETQRLLDGVKSSFDKIKSDIEDHDLIRLYSELIEKLFAVPIDPLIQKIALESDAHIKYVKHQHIVQFLPDSYIKVELIYDGVRLGQAKSRWFTPEGASDIVDGIIDYWPLPTWKHFASLQRAMDEANDVSLYDGGYVLSKGDIHKMLYSLDRAK